MHLFENFDRKEFEVDVLGIRKGVDSALSGSEAAWPRF
jgi:hypothetical protein